MQTTVTESKEPKGWLVKFVSDENSTFRYILDWEGRFAAVNPFMTHPDQVFDTFDEAMEHLVDNLPEVML